MKTLTVMNSGTEAKMCADMLQANGIDALINGSREYASIITGSDLGSYKILVPEEDLAQAQQLLAKVESTNTQLDDHNGDNQIVVNPRSFLKRSVIYAIMSFIVLPLVFNVVSIKNLALYARIQGHTLTGKFWVLFIILLNAAGLIIVIKIYKQLLI